MSRLKPWENRSIGASDGPAARTASCVPSKASTGPRSSGGGAHGPSPVARMPPAPRGPTGEPGGDGAGRDPGRRDRRALGHTYRLGTREPILLTIS